MALYGQGTVISIPFLFNAKRLVLPVTVVTETLRVLLIVSVVRLVMMCVTASAILSARVMTERAKNVMVVSLVTLNAILIVTMNVKVM